MIVEIYGLKTHRLRIAGTTIIYLCLFICCCFARSVELTGFSGIGYGKAVVSVHVDLFRDDAFKQNVFKNMVMRELERLIDENKIERSDIFIVSPDDHRFPQKWVVFLDDGSPGFFDELNSIIIFVTSVGAVCWDGAAEINK